MVQELQLHHLLDTLMYTVTYGFKIYQNLQEEDESHRKLAQRQCISLRQLFIDLRKMVHRLIKLITKISTSQFQSFPIFEYHHLSKSLPLTKCQILI